MAHWIRTFFAEGLADVPAKALRFLVPRTRSA